MLKSSAVLINQLHRRSITRLEEQYILLEFQGTCLREHRRDPVAWNRWPKSFQSCTWAGSHGGDPRARQHPADASRAGAALHTARQRWACRVASLWRNAEGARLRIRRMLHWRGEEGAATGGRATWPEAGEEQAAGGVGGDIWTSSWPAAEWVLPCVLLCKTASDNWGGLSEIV